MNVLITGLGSIAQKHIHALNQLYPNANIYALRSGRTSHDQAGIHSIHQLSELTVILDFAIISNPTSLHAETIESLLPLNCPLMIEKPLFHDLDKKQSLLTEIKNRKLFTYVACNLRFHPVIQFLHDEIKKDQKRINEVTVYCGSYLPDWRPGRNFRAQYSAMKEMGGGVQLDLIHEIDYTLWIFGKPLSVQSIKRNVSSLGISSDDYASYLLTYDQFTAHITLNYFRRDSKREIEIVLEDETWTADLNQCIIKNHRGEVLFHDPSYSIGNTYLKQMEYFTQAILEHTQPMNTVEEAFDTLTVALYEQTQQ